jgi:hypothetical protein
MTFMLEKPDERLALSEDIRQMREGNRLEQLDEAQWIALQGSADDALDQLETSIRRVPRDAVYARFLPAFHSLRQNDRFRKMTKDVPGSSWTDF